MFGRSYSSTRLKLQLKLAISRLKILQNKKNHLGQQMRREVALLLEKGKEESARIKVEHIIREDFAVEALEILELYCDLLLARFGLIDEMEECDPAISEAVNTLIFAAPRCEVKEILEARELFALKYGKEFCRDAMENKNDVVNPRIMQKLKVQTPDPFLVNQYLKEIARSFNLPWEGDVSILDADDFVVDNIGDDGHFDDGYDNDGDHPVINVSKSSTRKLAVRKSSKKENDIERALEELFPHAPSSNLDADESDRVFDTRDKNIPEFATESSNEIAQRERDDEDTVTDAYSQSHQPMRSKYGDIQLDDSSGLRNPEAVDEEDVHELEELARKFQSMRDRKG